MKVAIVVALLVTCHLLTQFTRGAIAQEKNKAAHTDPASVKNDTTLVISLSKFNTRLHELQSLLERETQTRDQARAVLQQSEDNIKSLQAALTTMAMIKQDTTLHIGRSKDEVRKSR